MTGGYSFLEYLIDVLKSLNDLFDFRMLMARVPISWRQSAERLDQFRGAAQRFAQPRDNARSKRWHS